MRTHDFSIELGPTCGLDGGAQLAASLFLPDVVADHGTLELLVCLHGGGYRRSYWNAAFPGAQDYSYAAFACAQGRAVLTVDHLGMGESSAPEPETLLNRAMVAAANHHATATVVQGLADGRWARAARVVATGVGHSVGGMMVITQQAAHRSFARLAVLGWANQPMVLGDMDPATLAQIIQPGYIATPRAAMRTLFYAPDVPMDVVEADEANASLTPSCLGRDALTPGIVHAASAAIDVPVFVCHGSTDTSPDPHGEIRYFTASTDVTLLVLPQTGHCHNFAARRHVLWQRMDDWIASLPVPAAKTP